MIETETCELCGQGLSGSSHYHCPNCGGRCSMMGHYDPTKRDYSCTRSEEPKVVEWRKKHSVTLKGSETMSSDQGTQPLDPETAHRWCREAIIRLWKDAADAPIASDAVKKALRIFDKYYPAPDAPGGSTVNRSRITPDALAKMGRIRQLAETIREGRKSSQMTPIILLLVDDLVNHVLSLDAAQVPGASPAKSGTLETNQCATNLTKQGAGASAADARSTSHLETHSAKTDGSSVTPSGTAQLVPGVECLDCRRSDSEMPLDCVLTGEQWEMIHPDGAGVLCASCIVKRASRLPGVINLTARITFASDFDGDAPGGRYFQFLKGMESGTSPAAGQGEGKELDEAASQLADKSEDEIFQQWSATDFDDNPRLAFCAARIDLIAINDSLRGQVEALEKFKSYVHSRLDAAGIPANPDGPHSKEGCRVGDRLDYVFSRMASWERSYRDLEAERARLRELAADIPERDPVTNLVHTVKSLVIQYADPKMPHHANKRAAENIGKILDILTAPAPSDAKPDQSTCKESLQVGDADRHRAQEVLKFINAKREQVRRERHAGWTAYDSACSDVAWEIERLFPGAGRVEEGK